MTENKITNNEIQRINKKLGSLEQQVNSLPNTILETNSDLLIEGLKSKRSFKSFLKNQLTIANITALLFLMTFIFTFREAREKYTQYIQQDAMVEAMVSTSYRLASEGVFRDTIYFSQALDVLEQARKMDPSNPYIFSASFYVEGAKELFEGNETKLIHYLQFQDNIDASLKRRSKLERLLSIKATDYLSELDKPKMVRINVLLGERLRQKGSFPYAHDVLDKAIVMSKSSNDKKWLINAYMTKSNTFLSNDKFQESLRFIKLAENELIPLSKSKDNTLLLTGLDGLGAVYQQKGIIQQNEEKFLEAMLSYEKSLEFYNELKKKLPKRDNKLSRGKVIHQMGHLSMEMGELNKAENYFNKSVKMKIEKNDKYGLVKTYTELGNLSIKQDKNIEISKDYFIKALSYAKELNNKIEIKFINKRLKCLDTLSATNE